MPRGRSICVGVCLYYMYLRLPRRGVDVFVVEIVEPERRVALQMTRTHTHARTRTRIHKRARAHARTHTHTHTHMGGSRDPTALHSNNT